MNQSNKSNVLLVILTLLMVILVGTIIYLVRDMRQQRDNALENERQMKELLEKSTSREDLSNHDPKPNISRNNDNSSSNSVSSSLSQAEEGPSESNSNVPVGQLPDGLYCYKGIWDSRNYNPQKCRIEFTKSGNSLSMCSYTNNNYGVIVPLSGSVNGTTVTLRGTARFEELVITLPLGNGLEHVVGDGTQGSLDDAVVRVDKVASSSEIGSKIKRVVGEYLGEGVSLSLLENGDAYFDGDSYTYSIKGDKVRLRDSNETIVFAFNSSSRTLKKGSVIYRKQ